MLAAADTVLEQVSQAGAFIGGIVVGAVIVVAVLRNIGPKD